MAWSITGDGLYAPKHNSMSFFYWQTINHTNSSLYGSRVARQCTNRSARHNFMPWDIWYDMLVRPGHSKAIPLGLDAELPVDARDQLLRLLASEPVERPKNAKAVKRWLEQV